LREAKGERRGGREREGEAESKLCAGGRKEAAETERQRERDQLAQRERDQLAQRERDQLAQRERD